MGNYYSGVMNSAYDSVLKHHGILGQKWGDRNGPPYPLKGGQYSYLERKEQKKSKNKYSQRNRRHFDTVVKKDTEFQTLSYDKNRTRDPNLDYFYTVYEKSDKDYYRTMFDNKAPAPIYDDDGNVIGTGKFYKYEIKNKAVKDLNIASEDTCVDAFADLYSNNRDFYNFVADPNRMKKYIGNSRDHKSTYRYAKKALDKIQNGEEVDKRDIQDVYAYFNYILPNDGKGDAKQAYDIAKQRARFFKELGKKGYSGLLDTNDSLYGEHYNAKMPIIIFDPLSVVLTGAERTKGYDKAISAINSTPAILKNLIRLDESRDRWKKK